ncbi:MAG: cob(I)yrinic acid a,c-diamide adenosyltransferase [Flavobacteriales bacterium]|nr:cob(I)yrinic acid a,c-diamide adenosyltransferase [Flavobacteriales bacterium]
MKIYTKTGDQGKTSLFSGTRVSKGHLRIHAYGTVDELNSYIGLLRDLSSDERMNLELIQVQDRLFTLGAHLATETEQAKSKLPVMTTSDVAALESAIDLMEQELDPIQSFILPGGHSTVSYCHIARCVCRRAERLVVELAENFTIDDVVIQYLNRLSDYLFMLSRILTKNLKVTETPWKPKKD